MGRGGSRGGGGLSERLGIAFYSGFKKNPGIHFYSGFREKNSWGGAIRNPGMTFIVASEKMHKGGAIGNPPKL